MVMKYYIQRLIPLVKTVIASANSLRKEILLWETILNYLCRTKGKFKEANKILAYQTGSMITWRGCTMYVITFYLHTIHCDATPHTESLALENQLL